MLKSEIVKEIALACGVECIDVPTTQEVHPLDLVGLPTFDQCREYENIMVVGAGGIGKLKLVDELVSYPPGLTPEIEQALINNRKSGIRK